MYLVLILLIEKHVEIDLSNPHAPNATEYFQFDKNEA